VPLGRAVGNWPEIQEVIACLRGEHNETPLMQIVRALAGEMIALGGEARDAAAGQEKAREAVESGAALERFRTFVAAQDGDPAIVDDPSSRPDSASVATVRVPDDAGDYVADLDALGIGQAALQLGAGRRTKEDDVDPVAGLTELKKPGDPVAPGDVLARLHTSRSPDLDAIQQAVRDAYTFADTPPALDPPVTARYSSEGWVKA